MVKFGDKLESEVFVDWKFYSLDYKELKRRIGAEPYTLTEYREFQRSLDDEKAKVNAFFRLKYTELVRRIEAMEKALPSLEQALKGVPQAHDDAHAPQYETSETGSDGVSEGPSAEESHKMAQQLRLSHLDQEIGRVSQEVKDLAYFSGMTFAFPVSDFAYI
ncbi:hypothetical protein BC830DRAFT_130557 [Chytriomyces sp. MP71]|nr:hypothetical protein BC830DRAFT_130557 [Chytriomyces sp. MP71]